MHRVKNGFTKYSCDPSVAALQHYFRQQPAIKLVILFGSVARGQARYESDIDLAVASDHALDAVERVRLIEDIAAMTGRAVDLIDLKTVGQPLLGQIIQHGQRLVGDDAAYGMLLAKNALDQADFLPYRQRILETRRKAWIDC